MIKPLLIQISLKGTLRLVIFLLLPIYSFAQPNELCGNAILLTSSTTCANTAGTLSSSAYTAIAGACGTWNDVWYTFVANSTNPTVSITSAPANSRFQIFSGTCTAPSSVYCSTAPLIQIPVSLTVGATYLIRVYSTSNATGTFNICIT